MSCLIDVPGLIKARAGGRDDVGVIGWYMSVSRPRPALLVRGFHHQLHHHGLAELDARGLGHAVQEGRPARSEARRRTVGAGAARRSIDRRTEL